MKPYDKYQFNKKVKEVGKLSWILLVFFSKITVFLFLIITAITYWQNVTIDLFFNQGVDISSQVSKMFLIVLLALGLISIDWITKNGKNM